MINYLCVRIDIKPIELNALICIDRLLKMKNHLLIQYVLKLVLKTYWTFEMDSTHFSVYNSVCLLLENEIIVYSETRVN